MKVRYHPEARAELAAAAQWYEQRRGSLGEDFLREVRRAEALVGERPETWAAWPDALPARRFVLTRFPFSLAYLIQSDQVVVLAVAHQRREPGYWLKRLPGP